MLRVAELETWSPAFFRDVLKAVAVVTEEPTITLDPEGLRIVNMSPDHYAMVDLLLTPGFFDSFNVVEEYRAALNVKDLHKLLFNRKTGKLKNSSLSMRFEGDKATFKGTGKLGGVKSFNLLDPYEDDPTPKLIYKAEVTLVTPTLKRIIEDCTVDYNVTITADPDKVVFRCESGDYLEENTVDKYADDMLNLNVEGTQNALFWLEHLEKFPRVLVKIAEVVTLEFSSGQPLRISADLPGGSHIVYYIPPKTITRAEPEEPTADPVPHEEPEKVPEPYTCENCGVDIPAAQGQNQIDMVLCETCAALPGAEPEEIPAVDLVLDPHEEPLSPGELYQKYYLEALARHSAEDA